MEQGAIGDEHGAPVKYPERVSAPDKQATRLTG